MELIVDDERKTERQKALPVIRSCDQTRAFRSTRMTVDVQSGEELRRKESLKAVSKD